MLNIVLRQWHYLWNIQWEFKVSYNGQWSGWYRHLQISLHKLFYVCMFCNLGTLNGLLSITGLSPKLQYDPEGLCVSHVFYFFCIIRNILMQWQSRFTVHPSYATWPCYNCERNVNCQRNVNVSAFVHLKYPPEAVLHPDRGRGKKSYKIPSEDPFECYCHKLEIMHHLRVVEEVWNIERMGSAVSQRLPCPCYTVWFSLLGTARKANK